MKKLITLALMLTAFCGVSMADSYTVVGDNATIFGSTWAPSETANDMIAVGDGTYRKTYSGITIADGTTIQFKVAKDHGWATTYGMNGSDGNGWFYVVKGGTYDITFICNPSSNINGDFKVDCKVGNSVYVLTKADGGSWTVGDKITAVGGEYSATINATANMMFALAPESAISSGSISNWSGVVRPEATDHYMVKLEHMGDKVRTYDNDHVWKAGEAATYTFKYDSYHNTFTSDAQTTVSVNAAAGWATFSLGETGNSHGYTVSGADAFYVASTADGKAVLTSIASGKKIPTYPDGIMLKKIGGGSVTITTTAESDVTLTGNMLQGSGCYTDWNLNNSGYTGYYLYNGASGLGFYPANTGVMSPYKAFLMVPDGGARDFFSFEEETTGIKQIIANVQQTNEYFNLAGQKVAQPTKGLYIVNGKKVIIK